MIYKNIDFHNVEYLIEDGKVGCRWSRFPKNVYDNLESDSARQMASYYTGVELRFVMNSDQVTIRLAKNYPDENPRLIHRLDKSTSGVLVIGRNKKTTEILSEYFKK